MVRCTRTPSPCNAKDAPRSAMEVCPPPRRSLCEGTQPHPGAARPKAAHPPRPRCTTCSASHSSWGYLGRYKPIPHPARAGIHPQRWAERFGGGRAGTCCPSWGRGGMPSPEGTWRSQLRLAGGAGQGQALPEPVHPVEPQGQLCFRHGFQGFGRSEGEFGLIGQAGLGALGVSGAPRLEGERREVRGELRWVPQPWSASLDAAMRCSCVSSGGRCWDGAARVRLSRIQGCSVLDPQLSQHTSVVQIQCQLEASSISCSKHVQPLPLPPAIARSRFPLQAGSTLHFKASRCRSRRL